MELQSLSNLTGVSVKRLLYYNDAKANKKPAKGELWYLKPKRSKAQETYHIVENGENLWTISQKYGIKLNQLRKKNHIAKNQSTVKTGRVLWLMETRPSGTAVAFVETEPEPSIEKKQPISLRTSSTTDPNQNQPDATPTKNEEPVKTVESANNRDETLKPIKQDAPKNIAISNEKVHTVQQGETLYGISKQYQVSINNLRTWNQIENDAVLSIGQQLRIVEEVADDAPESTPQESTESNFELHQVQAGETLYQVARQYKATIKELMELNEKEDFNLQIGEQLKVPIKP